MKQFDKKDLIKNFILEDNNRFSLAGDIFDNFKLIIGDILNDIQERLINHVNDENSIHLKLSGSGTMANYHFFRADIDSKYYLSFESYYYFKTYCLRLRGDGGFDKKNDSHLALHDHLKTKKYEFLAVSNEEWGIVNLNNKYFETNIGGGPRSLLFNLLKGNNDEFCKTLGDNFNQIFRDGIVEIVKAVLAK